jgi:Na+-transporting NADH:ubiquinone oxidoreductase subunit NqrA
VEFLANSSKDFEELDVRLRVELSLISGSCGCTLKCKTDPNYIGALDQAINLLDECDNLEHFRQKLMSIK